MADKGKNDVCRDYLRGTCTRGAKCKYAHVSSSEAAVAGLSFRTEKPIEFCHDFQNGRCNRPTCKYIHCSKEEEEEFRRSGKLPSQFGVDASPYQAIPTATGRRVQDQGDAFLDFGGAIMPLGGAQFLGGNAQKNTALALQQSVQAFQQMAAAASFPQFSQAAVSEQICKDNLAGKCTRGSRCKYRHVTRTQFDYESQGHDNSRRNGGFGDRRKRSRSRSRSRSSRSRSRSSSRDGRGRRLAGIGANALVDPLAASALGVGAMLNLPGGAQQGLLNVNPAVNAGFFGMPAATAGMLGMPVDPSSMQMAYMQMMSVPGAANLSAAAAANLNSMFAAASGGASLAQANVDPFSYATNQ